MRARLVALLAAAVLGAGGGAATALLTDDDAETAPYADPQHAASFRTNALFVGGNVRKAIAEGRGDYLPVFLSEVPLLFRRGILQQSYFAWIRLSS